MQAQGALGLSRSDRLQEETWASESLVVRMGNTLDLEHVAPFPDPKLDGAHVENMRGWFQGQTVCMTDNHRAPFAADRQRLHSAGGMSDTGEEADTLAVRNGHIAG